jgi:iron complex outermembrane receptor protein
MAAAALAAVVSGAAVLAEVGAAAAAEAGDRRWAGGSRSRSITRYTSRISSWSAAQVPYSTCSTARPRVGRAGPVLDLLNGAAAGGAGGQYQHEIEAQMGYTDNGYGARLSADWRSATTVVGGGPGGAGNLNFSDVATVNLRFWDDFTPQRAVIERFPLLHGVRVTLSILNLFDQSIKVRDSAGPTPLIYQSAFLDPTGRVIQINLRKLFD